MKIVAGELGGRPFKQPPTRAVRPMSEKVRAALFDVVGSPGDWVVCDAYAGSGAAGFEAASRGAILVEAIEANARVARLIAGNAASLELGWGYVLYQQTVESWLASPGQQPPISRYHLIIADPPYAQLDTDVLSRLGQFLLKDGVLVVSHTARRPSPPLDIPLHKTKVYGDAALSFYAQ